MNLQQTHNYKLKLFEPIITYIIIVDVSLGNVISTF